MSGEKKEAEVKEGGAGKGNEDEYDDDPDKNLDEILDELKDEEEGEDEGMDEGEHRDQMSDDENGEADELGDGASQSKEEGEDKDKTKEEKDKDRKEMRFDPSKGFLENEQDKMITGNWKYRMKIQAFSFEAREHNQENIERLINLSLSSAVYYFNRGHASGKKLGRMELFCSSQHTTEMAMETVLKHEVRRPLAVYIMRKVNIEDKELAYVTVMPYSAIGMRFKPLQRMSPGGKPSSRSVKVSNIPEGTSDELLQALFPCCINVVKPEEVDGKSPGWAVLECLDKNSMISVLKTYRKVQISQNLLELSACYKSKSATTLVDQAKKKEAEEAKAKKEEKKEKKDDDDEEKDDEEEEEDEEGEEKSERHSTRKSSAGDDDVVVRKHGGHYRGMRGGSGYRPRGGSRYRPYDRYQDRGRSYEDRRETEALKDQIAMLQENISMLTQSMTPMMMGGGGGGGGSSGHSSMSRRQHSDSGRYRDEYTTSSRYSGNSRDYASSSSYSRGNSWSDPPYTTGASRKRSYWDDDYGSTTSRSSYKKYY